VAVVVSMRARGSGTDVASIFLSLFKAFPRSDDWTQKNRQTDHTLSPHQSRLFKRSAIKYSDILANVWLKSGHFLTGENCKKWGKKELCIDKYVFF
jgi:hypothetical protein